jgi:predicted transcriptional regulator
MNNRTEPIRERIYKLLKERPCTDEEIGEALDLKGDTVRPRRGELLTEGRICDVGTRLTRSKRNAVVWGAVAS